MTKAVQDDAETMEDVVDAHVIDHLVNGPATHSELMTKAREVDAEIVRVREELTLYKVRVDDLSEQWSITQQALEQAHAERDALAAALQRAGCQHDWIQPSSTNALPWTACGRCGERYAREALTRMGETEVTT